MADERDDASPWERDDWIPDSAVPDADVFARPGGGAPPGEPRANGSVGEPAPEHFADDPERPGRPRRSIGNKLVAGAIVGALVVGSAGALLRNGDDSDATDSTEPTPAPSNSEQPENTSAEVGAATTAPPPTTRTQATPLPPIAAGASTPIEVGAPPTWSERTIRVPEPLVAIAPTEVITLSQSDIVSVTEFPSGRTRSVDASSLGEGLQLVVGDGTIAVFDSTNILQIRDGEPVVASSVPDGVIFMEPWPGTGQFIVTTPATGPSGSEQELVLRSDGTLVPLDDRLADEVRFWSRSFSPSGDVLVSRPGGVYAIDPVGESRRISTGDLVATGDAHWAIEECDEELRCAYSIVAWDNGEVTPGVLDVIESFGFIDPATRISPDGRSIVYRSDVDGSGRRRILDVATGSTVEAGRINQFAYPDAWATDSSGIFVTDRFVEYVERASGQRTPIEDLDGIRAVATGPFSSSG